MEGQCCSCDNYAHTGSDYGRCSVKGEDVMDNGIPCDKYVTGHPFYCESCDLQYGEEFWTEENETNFKNFK